MPPQSPGEIAAVINNAVAQNTRHLVIQLDRPVDGKLRHRLESVGVRPLDYLGSHAFFAALLPERLAFRLLL